MIPFSHHTCLNPVKIVDFDGSVSYVPCGHCTACNFRKQSKWSQRLELHCKNTELFPVFITLTYDNDNLPLVYYDSCNEVTHLSVTRTRKLPPNTVNHLPDDIYDSVTRSWYRRTRFSITPDFIFDFQLNDCYKPHFVESRHLDDYIYNTDNCFGICYLPDIQNFIKRLRRTLSEIPSLSGENLSFDYFICSEYGPETFRPHYHGILFFRSSRVATMSIDRLIYQCWGKQNNTINRDSDSPIASLVTKDFSASAYVSKYVTCSSDLPCLLRSSSFRPFHTQSKTIPIGSCSFYISDVPRMLFEDAIVYHKSFIDPDTKENITIEKTYPDSSWSRVFPEFLCSRFLDLPLKEEIFHKLYRISLSGSDIPDTRSIVENKLGLGKFIKLASLEKNKHSGTLYSILDPKDRYESYSLLRDPHCFLCKDGSILKCRPFCISKVVGFNFSVYKITPSYIIDSTEWIRSNLDLYLFGFERNRCACRKIISCMRSFTWCKSPIFYCRLYDLYFIKLFSYSLKLYYSNVLSCSNLSLFDLYHIYYSFFDSLPDDASVLTESQYNLLDSFLSTYGFDFSDLYDNYDKKRNFNFWSSDVGLSYLNYLSFKKSKQKNDTLYNHEIFNEL